MKLPFVILLFFCCVVQGITQPAVSTDETLSAHIAYNIMFESDLAKFMDVETQSKKYIAKEAHTFLQNRDFIIFQLKNNHLPDSLQYIPLALTYKNIQGLDNYNSAGLWNLSIPVALKYGLVVNANFDERFDVKKSTIAATKYLKDLSALYNQDYTKVLLAYIASPSELSTANLKNTDKSPLSFTDYYYTNLYNRECIPAYFTSKNLINTMPYQDIGNPIECFMVQITKPLSIEALEEYGVASKEEFRTMNPIIRSNVAQPHAHIYLNIPIDKENRFKLYEDSLYNRTNQLFNPPVVKTEEIQTIVKESTPKALQTYAKQTVHTVKRGDCLGNIANKYNVGIAQLKKWNNLNSDKISIGQKLIIKK